MGKGMEDDMAEAKRDEVVAQKYYEEMMNEAATKRSDESKLMVTKEGVKAEKTTKLEEQKESKRTRKGQLEVLDDKIDILHKTCDFLIAQYAVILRTWTRASPRRRSSAGTSTRSTWRRLLPTRPWSSSSAWPRTA